MEGSAPLRPLSVGEILDASFSAVRRNLGPLVVCVAVVVVPIAILQTLIQASVTDDAFDFTTTETEITTDDGTAIAALIVSYVVLGIAQILAPAACLRIIGSDLVGTRATAGDSIRFALRRLGPILWVTILFGLTVIAGVLLCFIGSVWFYIMFAVAVPALLFEDCRGTKAMGRSRALVKDNWWRTFGALIVMYLLVTIVSFVLGALLGFVLLADSDSEALNATLTTLVTIVSYLITLPLSAAVTAFIYFDLRVRKEGLDLQLMAQRIGGGGDGPVAPTTVAGLPADEGGFLPPQPPSQ